MTMRKEYDFSKAQKNPFASRLKRQVILRMDEGTISYFKTLTLDNTLGLYTSFCLSVFLFRVMDILKSVRSVFRVFSVFRGFNGF